MSYDSPKAAHFDAWRRGKKLPPMDAAGLEARWAMARAVAEIGVDMLAMSEDEKQAVREFLRTRYSFHSCIAVTLAGERPE